MRSKRKGRTKLRAHAKVDLDIATGKRPKLLPPMQRAKPERSDAYFQKRKVFKKSRMELMQTAHEAKKTGRPLEYLGEVHDDLCLDMRLLGCTKEQLAGAMFVDVATITRWLNDHPSFNAAWLAGSDQADALIVNKMFQKALGYKMPVTKVFFDSKNGEVIEHEMVEHFPPDQKAAEFILTNRQRGHWRHRQDSSLVDNDGNSLVPPTLMIQPVKAAPRPDDD